jgi:hypothetical protein
MIRILIGLMFIFCVNKTHAQNFKGQWKGSFIDKSTTAFNWGGDKCDYVVDLEGSGDNIKGYTYTYFTDGGKKYYTICKLKGFFDSQKKYVEITETERTKTNVPVNISNSFQVHKLKWRKEDGHEYLEGTWTPAPGQGKENLGYGTTILSKRMLRDIAPSAKINGIKRGSPEKTTASARPTPKQKVDQVITPRKVTTPPVAAKVPVKKQPASTAKVNIKPKVLKPVAALKPDTANTKTIVAKPAIPKVQEIPLLQFEKRNTAILETVTVESSTINIELYDNGEVDGDSVSLIYNGKVLLAHKRLSEKAISLDIIVPDNSINELVMYADNLGTLPPNTSLMIVHDGSKRYEVRITSDLSKSGTIRFVHKPKT